MDISAAFLQGYDIKRNVYLRPPKDIEEPGIIWKLKRCIYVLNDAPRSWYGRVCDEMINLGAVQSSFDKVLFTWYKGGKLCGILVAHVDDFAFAGTDEWRNAVIIGLKKKFKISAECDPSNI